MYIKIIGGLFMMCAAVSIGFLKAEELNVRVKRLQELKRMILLLQGELRFHRAVLSEAFENVSERIAEPFCSFLKETAEGIAAQNRESFGEIWTETSQKLLRIEGFRKEDGQLLELLGNSLGYLDLTMQTENLNLTLLQMEDAISRAKEQQAEKGKLYQTMGVTVGALLTLLII